jgi:hypothetical protein
VSELRAAAQRVREARERAEAVAREQAKTAADAARRRRLDALSVRVDAAWSELEALVDEKNYDAAIKLAIDLRDVARRDGSVAAFAKRFEALRKRQLRRRGFFDRWKLQNEPAQAYAGA